MKTEHSKYQLNKTEYEYTLAILKKEQQANAPSPRQRKLYILFNISIYGFLISLVVDLSVYFLPEAWVADEVWITILAIFFFINLLFGILIPVFFFSNVGLISKIWRQMRLLRKHELSAIFRANWRIEQNKGIFFRILRFLLASIGIFLILLAVFGLLFVIIDPTQFEFFAEYGRILPISLLIILVLICLAIVFSFFIRRNKLRFEAAGQLLSSMEDSWGNKEQADKNQIDIPFEDYTRIAQIERDQILREREESLLSKFKETDYSEYSIQKSFSVRESLKALDLELRLIIDSLIDKLSVNPNIPDVIKDSSTQIRKIYIGEPPYEISFLVDEEKRHIKITELTLLPDRTSSNS